jgi:hypothetical protein
VLAALAARPLLSTTLTALLAVPAVTPLSA